LGSYDFPPLGGRPFLQRPLANTAFDVPGSEHSDINVMGMMTEEFSRQGTYYFIKHCFKNSLFILNFILFNEDTGAELNICSVNERITYYRKRWKDHINRIEGYRLPKQIRKYKPKGERDVARPMKRWDYKYKICEIVKAEQANCLYLVVEKKKKFHSKVLYSMCRKLANCGQR
jgi:hypothetical protein